MHPRRHRLAPEGRQMIAHGVSRGSGSSRSPAPVGAKDFGWETNCLHLVFRPSGAHSSICLVPPLTPWAIVLRLSEANPVVHDLGRKRIYQIES